MTEHSKDLKRFERRVRLVRSWRGLAVGACVGSLAATVWAGLDWANLAYAEWAGLGILVGACSILGLVAGGLMKVSPRGLADSIDRRADLEDRLITSLEREGSDAGFDAALHADAQAHLHGLKPARLYPVRVGKWQGAALALCALASVIFLLGNTPVFLNDQQKKDREELKQAGQAVQRVIKPIEEDLKIPSQNLDEKRLAAEMRRLAKEMEKARISKEEAMQKSNELQKQAAELTKDRAQKTESSLATAESAMKDLEKAEQEKNGLDKMSPEDAKMSQAQRDSKADSFEKQQNSLQQQIAALQQQLSQPGTQKGQQQELDAKLQKLLSQQKALQKELQQLKLSKEVQDMLRRMMESPIYKELQEMAKKLAEASKQAEQDPSAPPQLTKEQLEEMEKQLEELAKQLKDDKAMEEYLKALKEALKNAKEMGLGNGMGLGLGLGLSALAGESSSSSSSSTSNSYDPFSGPGAPSKDTYFANAKQVHHSDKPEESKGKTTLTSVTGQRDDTKPGETYIEIKGPTMVGNRSSVAYSKDVLSYKKKAEQAINRQKIPKEHEKRVKAYFDSLTKG